VHAIESVESEMIVAYCVRQTDSCIRCVSELELVHTSVKSEMICYCVRQTEIRASSFVSELE